MKAVFGRESNNKGPVFLLTGAILAIWLSLSPVDATESAQEPAVGLPAAPDYLPGTRVSPEPKTAGTIPKIWQKLLVFRPPPGEFALVTGSAVRPYLVKKGEFDFCGQIKCHRSGAVLGAWNGGAFDRIRGQFRLHGGGHADYGGNEVYAFDFPSLTWARETDPAPLTGPFLKDKNGDGIADACPAPAAGPAATHTYQGFIYVPKIDRYWLFGTVQYCRGGMAGSTAWEYDANRKTWTPLPQLDRFARFARTLIDPVSGNVVVHVGRKRQWHEIDVVKREVVRSSSRDPFGSYIDGPAVFDSEKRVIYALMKAGKVDRIVAYGWPAEGEIQLGKNASARVVAQWPRGGKKAWGMALHSSGLLVLWDGNARIVTVDPRTGATQELESAGYRHQSHAKNGRPAKVYSKWAYIPELDVFFGITNPDLGFVLYRLGGRPIKTAALPAEHSKPKKKGANDTVRKTPAKQARKPAGAQAATRANPQAPRDGDRIIPLEVEAAAPWAEVCAGAVLCDPMGPGEVIYRGKVVEAGPPKRGKSWRRIGQKFNHPKAQLASYDPEVGGLRFTFPSLSGSGAAGNFRTNFSPDYSFQVGPPGTGAATSNVYIQFQVRYSCTFIWTDCNPESPDYRKVRRCFKSKGKGCTASKIALISTGDREDFVADACTLIQTAINHRTDHTLHGFHRCPRVRGFGMRLPRIGGRAQSNSQPNGLYHCPNILRDNSKSTWNNTEDSCFRLIDEKWITIQINLRFGPAQLKPAKGDPKLSHASIWAAVEGMDGGRQRLVIDNGFYGMNPERPNDLVGKIWLMPHLYLKSGKESHPPFFVWYRNLVVSEKMIPNPS